MDEREREWREQWAARCDELAAAHLGAAGDVSRRLESGVSGPLGDLAIYGAAVLGGVLRDLGRELREGI